MSIQVQVMIFFFFFRWIKSISLYIFIYLCTYTFLYPYAPFSSSPLPFLSSFPFLSFPSSFGEEGISKKRKGMLLLLSASLPSFITPPNGYFFRPFFTSFCLLVLLAIVTNSLAPYPFRVLFPCLALYSFSYQYGCQFGVFLNGCCINLPIFGVGL